MKKALLSLIAISCLIVTASYSNSGVIKETPQYAVSMVEIAPVVSPAEVVLNNATATPAYVELQTIAVTAITDSEAPPGKWSQKLGEVNRVTYQKKFFEYSLGLRWPSLT
jgi:hypothetical protein